MGGLEPALNYVQLLAEPHFHIRLCSACLRSLQGPLNPHADHCPDRVDDDVGSFKGVAVSDDFAYFVDRADGGDERRDLRRRASRPAQAIRKGQQRVGGQMRHPVHGAGKSLTRCRDAADGE